MFLVSEYLSRIEQEALDILESMKPIDKTITLWWGLDGLRLNEDGTTKWVSREKNKSAETVFCQSFQPIRSGMLLADQMQSTRAQIDTLMLRKTSLEIQGLVDAHNMQFANMYGGCCCNFVG